MSKVNIPTFKLNSGYQIPVLGYGTFLGFNDKNEFDYSDWDKMLKTLSYCIDVGYRHIDTAHLYRVEPDIGEVVNRKIKEGVVTREEMFITTKVWQHFHRKADVEVAVRGSLRRLGLDYLDLVLIHWPMAISVEGVDEKIDYLETWRGFESVLSKGLVRSIGVSNFNVEQLKRLVANCKVKPAVNQVELNLAHGQKELVEYCKTQNIKVTAWAPFGAMIASRALPDAPAPRVDDPTLVAIAKKYGKTVMQVTLRYLYQRGIITIPKTVTPSRVLENALIFDFELTPSDCSALAKFDVNYRSSRPTFWQNYTNYPFEKYDVPEEAVPECQRKWKDGKTNDKME
ncbi:aldo-keto reductase AKR2E4-like [Choristoneura fumiferana]|uniref:aldo-keto reductase AKR2E4-like n=1 Tax=Choristoneura fumiferana TaxID=7141 RepID=UPI003D153D4F